MSHQTQPATDPPPTEALPSGTSGDLKDGDPTVDPKKGAAEQGINAYGTYVDEETESSH
jgi:hypothetical protein